MTQLLWLQLQPQQLGQPQLPPDFCCGCHWTQLAVVRCCGCQWWAVWRAQWWARASARLRRTLPPQVWRRRTPWRVCAGLTRLQVPARSRAHVSTTPLLTMQRRATFRSHSHVCVCVCVCVCARGRGRKRKRERDRKGVCVCVCLHARTSMLYVGLPPPPHSASVAMRGTCASTSVISGVRCPSGGTVPGTKPHKRGVSTGVARRTALRGTLSTVATCSMSTHRHTRHTHTLVFLYMLYYARVVR